MDYQTQLRIAREFLARVTMSPDRVIQLADQIQEQGKAKPELIAECKFGRSMQVRRLRSVAPRNWNPGDYHNADNILTEIGEVIMQDGEGWDAQRVLALTVLGVESEHLDRALAILTNQSPGNCNPPIDSSAGKPADKPQPRQPEPQSGKEIRHVTQQVSKTAVQRK